MTAIRKPIKAVTHKRIPKEAYSILDRWLNASGVPPHMVSRGVLCREDNKVNVCFISDYDRKGVFERLLEKAARLDNAEDVKFWEKKLRGTCGGHNLRLYEDILC